MLSDLRSERDILKVDLAENDFEDRMTALSRKLEEETAKKQAVYKQHI